MGPEQLHDVMPGRGKSALPTGRDERSGSALRRAPLPPAAGPGERRRMSPFRLALVLVLLVVVTPYWLVQLWEAVKLSHFLLGEAAQLTFLLIAFFSGTGAVRLWLRPGRPARVKQLELTANMPWAAWYMPNILCAIITVYMLFGALL